ncbi:MAG: hypothetical protein ACTSRB_17805, partial [Candidatus Helarchaeota archaeon]
PKTIKEKRGYLLGLSIATIVFSAIGFFFTFVSPFPINPMANWWNPPIGYWNIFGMLGFIGALCTCGAYAMILDVVFEFSVLHVNEPLWAIKNNGFFGSTRYNKYHYKIFKDIKAVFWIYVGIFLLLQFASIILFRFGLIYAFQAIFPSSFNYLFLAVMGTWQIFYVFCVIAWFIHPILGIIVLSISQFRNVSFLFSFMIPMVNKVPVQGYIGPVERIPEVEKKYRIKRNVEKGIEQFTKGIVDSVQRITSKVEEKIERKTKPIERNTSEKSIVYSKPEIYSTKEPIKTVRTIEVMRGGQILGKEYVFKLKIVNNTEFIINDVRAIITSFPSDSLEIDSEMEKRSKIEPNGDFVSVSFNFKPSKDCVQGKIYSMVTYLDAKGESHQIKVPPHEIRMICGLLTPVKIQSEEFDKITKGLIDYEKAGEEVTLPFNCEKVFNKTMVILPKNNFEILNTELIEVGNNKIGLIKGFAKGKYSGNKVGLMITLTGEKTANKCVAKIDAFTEDKDMLAPLISEISQDLTTISCNQCGAALTPEQIKMLMDGKPITCKFCGEVIARKG